MATTKELVDQINQLFMENKMDAFMDYMAEDVVWDMYASSMGHMRLEGKNALLAMGGQDTPEHTSFQFGTTVIEGNRASVQGSSTKKKGDGTEIESHFCEVYQFEGDKIVHISSYIVDRIKE